jgi:hypothetical protein
VAFALAFGLGGRQPAERVLTDLIDKAKREAKNPNPVKDKAGNSLFSGMGAKASTTATDMDLAGTTGAGSSAAMAGANSMSNQQQSQPGTNPLSSDFSHTTPAALTTAPQDDETLETDQAVPDSLKVDPAHPATNNPFGSTGEKEPDVDISTQKKDDPK